MRGLGKFQPRRENPHPTRLRRATFSRGREKDSLVAAPSPPPEIWKRLELSLGEASEPICPSRVSRDVQFRARLVFVYARERQILLGGARLSPQARRFDPLPVFGHRALAFSRLLLVQLFEISFQGQYGLPRLTIILLRLDHESGLRGAAAVAGGAVAADKGGERTAAEKSKARQQRRAKPPGPRPSPWMNPLSAGARRTRSEFDFVINRHPPESPRPTVCLPPADPATPRRGLLARVIGQKHRDRAAHVVANL